MAAVRYLWMFRAAAVVFLAFGLSSVWRYGFTDYDAPHRLWGLGLGLFAAVVGVFLFKPSRVAIVLLAIAAGVLAIAAAVAAPIMKGPVVLAFALFALLFGSYAGFAARALTKGTQ